MSLLSVLLIRFHFSSRTPSCVPRAVLAAALLFGGASLASAAGSYIGWFNGFVSDKGGLAVSPVAKDWGQDLVELSDVVKEEGLTNVWYLDPTRTRRFELAHQGVKFHLAHCGLNFSAPLGGPGFLVVHEHTRQLLAADCIEGLVGRTASVELAHGRLAIYAIPFKS